MEGPSVLRAVLNRLDISLHCTRAGHGCGVCYRVHGTFRRGREGVATWEVVVHQSQAAGHIEAGAKKVIISAPGKGDLKTLAALTQKC